MARIEWTEASEPTITGYIVPGAYMAPSFSRVPLGSRPEKMMPESRMVHCPRVQSGVHKDGAFAALTSECSWLRMAETRGSGEREARQIRICFVPPPGSL